MAEYEKISPRQHSNNTACGEGGSFFAHYRAGGEKVVHTMYGVAIAVSEPEAPESPRSFTYAKTDPERIGDQIRAIADVEARPLRVHECGFRIACAAYVDPARTCAKLLTSEEQTGFLDAMMANIYDAEEKSHDLGEGKRRGGAFCSDMTKAFPGLHHK